MTTASARAWLARSGAQRAEEAVGEARVLVNSLCLWSRWPPSRMRESPGDRCAGGAASCSSPTSGHGGRADCWREATVLDFWRWGFSDLRLNIVRGVLAEFLVAKAVGATETPKEEWANFDVGTPASVRVEVRRPRTGRAGRSAGRRRPSSVA